MKKLFATIALSACLGISPLVYAASDAVDLKDATCNDLQSLDKDTLGMMLFWLDGYLSGITNDTSFSPSNLEQFVTSLSTACGEKPNAKLLELAKEVGISK